MRIVTNASDTDLVRLLTSGNEAAFQAIYERCGKSVYRFALHMSADPHIAEEVTQDTFLTLFRQPSAFDAARGTLCSWLLGIARNHARRAIGNAPDEDPLDDSNEIASSSDLLGDLTRRETIESVRQAVTSLPAVYREVIALCDLQEMDYRDAAVVLDCPVGTVRSRLHRARIMLLNKLQTRCLA